MGQTTTVLPSIYLSRTEVNHWALMPASKRKASEVAVRACEQAIQTLGGWGYIKDFPVEKWYRDAKLYTIFEGTIEIQRLVIGRALRANANTEPLDRRMDAPR